MNVDPAVGRKHRPLVARLRRTRLPQLRGDQRGLALVEFAFAFPFMMVLGATGLELANYVVTTKRVGEIAVMVADNASRMGAQSAINNKPVSEAEINDVFTGADMQASGLDLATQGRIILSSLQRNADDGQNIKWQRCFGGLDHDSSFGVEGDGDTGTSFAGMGPPSNLITAAPGTAVMVVEIRYRYRRLFPVFGLDLQDISDTAAFNVRDNRDLTQVYNTEAVTPSSCA